MLVDILNVEKSLLFWQLRMAIMKWTCVYVSLPAVANTTDAAVAVFIFVVVFFRCCFAKQVSLLQHTTIYKLLCSCVCLSVFFLFACIPVAISLLLLVTFGGPDSK